MSLLTGRIKAKTTATKHQGSQAEYAPLATFMGLGCCFISKGRFVDKSYSLEFFPARTEAGAEKLIQTATQFKALNPRFYSVTFGAGGTTQDSTAETVSNMIGQVGMPTAPHISCISTTRDSIKTMLDAYAEQGVNRLVTLRGDLPEGQTSPGEFNNANELVSFIREVSGDQFHLEVAAYPEFHPESANNPAADIDHFVNKVRAGADSAITQYFFNADAYFQFMEELAARNVFIPVVPGIMPITNYKQLARFSDTCGAEIPRWIRSRLAAYDAADDMASLKDFGHEVVMSLCEGLIANDVPGLHFYTLNQYEPVANLWQALELPNPDLGL